MTRATQATDTSRTREVIIIGGGCAGLSAAIYLGRAQRDTLVIDSDKSMARWEPEVENYLGFPEAIAGEELLARGRKQAQDHGIEFVQDEIMEASGGNGAFSIHGRDCGYRSRRLLLATGIRHIPPGLPGLDECLGHSMFFCKDCDGLRVQGQTILIYGCTNEAVEYALGMLVYSPRLGIVTDGRAPRWDAGHGRWLEEYRIPVYRGKVREVQRRGSQLNGLVFEDGVRVAVEALFTTRGDIYHNALATGLGARVDETGEIEVDAEMSTSVEGLYAAGCVTPANCQMIIAAGQGATAAQAINRSLFEESLANHCLRRFRERQIECEATIPATSTAK